MNTFKLRKVKTNQSYQASDCGVSYSLQPIYQDNDDAHTDTELVWTKEFETPSGYAVKKAYGVSGDSEDFILGIFDLNNELMSDEPVPIVNIKGRPALSKFSGGLLFLKEVASDI